MPKPNWLCASFNFSLTTCQLSADSSVTYLLAALPVAPLEFRRRALQWAAKFAHCAYFEPNEFTEYPNRPFERLLAVAEVPPDAPDNLPTLQSYLLPSASQAPRVGFITYEVKNEIEALSSQNFSGLEWPHLHFFTPVTWLYWRDEAVEIHGLTEGVLAQILAEHSADMLPPKVPFMRPRLAKTNYLQAVSNIREDILNGEVYELNLCQEFYAEHVDLNPVDIFWRLNEASPAPFAGFLRWHHHFLLCASPERFLAHQPPAIISQPIKGTIRRGTTPAEDVHQRQVLLDDEKERAENLMIVDLVRNDLARVAATGSVTVPELFGLYPFRHVWQMISTVQAQLRPHLDLVDVLRATFPMGSMTGAPKVRAMQLIEHYETTRRGLYSGSMGYVWPDGSFDFNVVIRSLQYRQDTGYLSFQVGSAITYDSDPEREYEECLLKATALLAVLGTRVAG
jgi:para-aminobenzoate synthetase component 1